MRTLIQGGWVVGFDGRGHTLIPDGVVVYEDRDILFVGRQFDGQVDKRVDASGQLVSPGLINCHIHAESNAPHILLTDHAKTDYFGENFLAYGAFKRGGRPSFQSRANVEGKFAAWMAVRGGATTVLDAGARPQALEPLTHMIGELGVRAYLGPGYRAASHVVDERGAIQLEWLPDGGMEGL
ncbi:MAG: hypothetical protein JOZ39_03130, partial [Chloroflexi bacterium]|nr:hypothetical protein [Chloroflexota bacterium]